MKTAIRILNYIIVITTFLAVGAYFIGGPDALGSSGVGAFKYFTTDSNILLAVACLIYLIYEKKSIPAWVKNLKLAGTVATTITLVTVIFFLVPMAYPKGGIGGVLRFYSGNVFVLHLSSPVLGIVTWLLEQHTCSKKEALWGILPTAIYSIVYGLMVIVLQVWNDWYGFTFGGRYYLVPLVLIVMYSVSYGIGILLTHKFKK